MLSRRRYSASISPVSSDTLSALHERAEHVAEGARKLQPHVPKEHGVLMMFDQDGRTSITCRSTVRSGAAFC